MADYISQIKLPNNDIYELKDNTAVRGNGRVFYGICSTAAGTVPKEVICDQYDNLTIGDILIVKFTNTNSATANDNLKLQIKNASGTTIEAKSIKQQYNSTGNSNLNAVDQLNSNGISAFIYNGTYWILLNGNYNNTYTVTSVWCNTAAATAAKTFSNASYYAANDKSYFEITFRYANSAKSALTLNGKTLYINGTVSSASNYTIPAGKYLVYYDNNIYYIRTDGKITGDITGDAATVNGLTVQTAVPTNAKFTDTNKYHKTGSWSGLTYTATAVGSADALAFTLPTGTGANQVALGNHTHTANDVGALANDTTITNVSYTNTTNSNQEYPVLFKYSTGSTTDAAGVRFISATNKSVTINGSTGVVTALGGFKGDLEGKADTAGDADTVAGFTVGKNVPSNAVFTDTWQPLSMSQDGYVSEAPGDTTKFLRGDANWATLPSATSSTPGITKVGASGGAAAYDHGVHVTSSTVKEALGVNATHNEQYLRKDGTWQTVQGGVSSVAELTGDITATALIEELGLSKALRFVGKTTSTMSEDFTGVPAGITNYTTPALGDVVLDKDDNYEYVCIAINNTNNTYTWEQLGGSGSWALDDHTHGNISNAGTKISTYDGTNDAATTTDHLFLREDGKWAKPKYTANTDYRVRQTISSTDNTYPLIFSSRTTDTASNSTAYEVYRNNSIYVNPSSGELHATTFYGALTGNVTGNVTGNITGDVTGNLNGNVTGNLSGNVTGNVTGDVTGNVSGTAGSWKNSVTVYTELSTSGTNSILKGGESSAVALKVHGTLGTVNGGLGNNSFTANRLLYSNTATKFDSTTNIYASTDAITINGTSAPENSSNFQVKGPSTMQNIYAQTDGTYDIGTDATRFRSVYLTTSLMVGAKSTIASYDSNATGSFIGSATISVCNKNSATGGYYLMANAVQQAKMYINTIGTTSTTGSTYLELGNNKTSTQANNSQGIIRLYSSDAVYTEIQPQITTNTSNVKTSKVFYLPKYTGSDNMYAIHAGSDDAVGSSTQQVYVAANGRITASDSTVGDSYAPTYLNDGETQITFPVQYKSFTIASGTTSVTLESSAYNQQISDMDVFVLAIVITSGEEYLNAPITWDTQQKANSTTIGQVILSTATATSDDVTGYILTARGCEAPSDSST